MRTKTAGVLTRSHRVVAGVFAATVLSSVALADSTSGSSETPRGTSETRIVKYADLDLTRSADVYELYQRIEDTAKRVCTPLGSVVPDDACLSDALERTVAKIGLPRLTSIYVAKIQQPAKPQSGPRPGADGVAVVGAFQAVAAAAVAGKAVTSDARAERVSVSDLDLSTSAGVNAARERVHQVVRRLCAQVADEFDLSHKANFDKCVDANMAKVQIAIQELAARKSIGPIVVGSN
jgi:UrcA family protein